MQPAPSAFLMAGDRLLEGLDDATQVLPHGRLAAARIARGKRFDDVSVLAQGPVGFLGAGPPVQQD